MMGTTGTETHTGVGGIKGTGEGLVLQHGVIGSGADMEGSREYDEFVFL